MNARQSAVAALCDGEKTSKQIAEILGERQKYVQEVALKFDLPRRKRGSAYGELNGSYSCGRRIDRDGYALTSAPHGHPFARMRKGRKTGVILEHRLVMEQKIGRYLDSSEIVDHIDGLRLHNDPSNLRLFGANAQHLRETITGQIPKWSKEGREKQKAPPFLRPLLPKVDTYSLMKKSGDARLRQILLAMLSLGEDSPYLLGTRRHLEKAGISDFSRTSLERELVRIYQQYA